MRPPPSDRTGGGSPQLAAPLPRVWVQNPSRARAGLLGWLFRYYLFLLLILLLTGFMGARQLYRSFAEKLPDLEAIARYETEAPGVTRMYAADGALLTELAREHRSYARIDEVPEPLIQAFLAAEDRRFYEHAGVDFRGIARATVANYRSGTIIQGGSTITQQVAKGFLSSDRTLSRKLSEAILAIRMESQLGKDQILEIYLNKIFLGHGSYGVSAAASRYFGKRLQDLSLAECALIAGLARAPSAYSPVSFPAAAERRRAVVLQDMVEAGYITDEERAVAAAEPIVLADLARDPFRWRAPYYAEHVRTALNEALGEQAVLEDGLSIETPVSLEFQAHAHAAIDRALRKMDRRQGWRGPEAHLPDPEAREVLRERMRSLYGKDPFAADAQQWHLALVTGVERRQALVEMGDWHAVLPLGQMDWAAPYDPNSGINDLKTSRVDLVLEVGDVVWVRPHLSSAGEGASERAATEDGAPIVELGQTPRVEAALYTLEHETGYVVGMEGGHDYDRSQFNRTTQACRQPGSVFKAIYYALALDTGTWEMDSILEGKAWEPEDGEEWTPGNIDKTLDGKVLLRTALIKSMNTPSIRLFLRLGADNVVDWARRLGFTSELIPDKALSLGASCVHSDELVRAFGIYVREGRWLEPVYVTRAIDKRGRVRIDHRHPRDGAMDLAGRIDRMAALGREAPEQVIDMRTAFLITRLLREVVTAGIGARAGHIGAPAGGKSGTASKGKYTTDTWFVGFTSREVTSAWMGDDAYERSLGEADASYTTAIPMWADYMELLVGDTPHGKVPVAKPPGIGSRTVDASRGGEPVPGLPKAVVYYRE